LILEFSKPVLKCIEPIYDFYSFNVLPILGELVAGDSESYQYLAESIRMHPDQEDMLDLMTQAGLEDSHYFNLSGGIVALHMGYKY
jgi:demethylmenaquinone methyltransferase/2-methoxy-6-polyprenyl-1,4-benzoquinol methylase